MRHVFHTVLLIPFDQRPYSRCHAADSVSRAAYNSKTGKSFEYDFRFQVSKAVTPLAKRRTSYDCRKASRSADRAGTGRSRLGRLHPSRTL